MVKNSIPLTEDTGLALLDALRELTTVIRQSIPLPVEDPCHRNQR